MAASSTGRLRVLHLVGSAVDQGLADLSRLYAADCLATHADPARYDHRVGFVEPGGTWRFPASLDRGDLEAAEPVGLTEAVARLVDLRADVALPHMFCLPGMTTYRALLELVGVPYVGNRPETMALGAHKARAKAVVAAAGVRVPAGVLVAAGAEAAAVPEGLRLPVVVKPVDADNSAGVGLVRDAEQWPAALRAARTGSGDLSGDVLVEEYVELGREVRCGVLDVDGELVCLPLEEYAVDPVGKPVRDAADKLRGSGDDLALVAKTSTHAWIVPPAGPGEAVDPVVAGVHEAARACYRALGCRDYGLFDFRLDPEGRPWFLEAGLYWAFARQSVISVMATADGRDLPTLLAEALDHARSRGTAGPGPGATPAPSTSPTGDPR